VRLQLTALFGLLSILAAAGPALAQEQVRTRVEVYSDGWITVVSPATRVQVMATEQLTVAGGVHVDHISGATLVVQADAITSATEFEERRIQGDLGVDFAGGATWGVGAGVYGSQEPDYTVTDGRFTVRAEFFERAASMVASLHLSHEGVGRAGDPAFLEHTWAQALNLSWTHILGPNTSLALFGTLQHASCDAGLGCHANPYRTVAVLDGDRVWGVVSERHPDRRVRSAAAFRLSQALGDRAGLHVGYRLYGDSWGVVGHTGRASGAVSLVDDRVLLKLDTRAAVQGPAAFHTDTLTVSAAGKVPEHRTADRELGGLRNGMVGGTAVVSVYGLGPVMRLDLSLRLARVWTWHPHDTEVPERHAWLLGGGLDARF
jgi:hypothetical protein